MPQLVWNESEFTQCLGVWPDIGEYEDSYFYCVRQDGLRLDLTVFPYSSDIYITLFCDGNARPLIDFKLIACSGTRYINDIRGEYLEFAPSLVFGDRFQRDYVIPVGLRLSVKPSISLEFFARSA